MIKRAIPGLQILYEPLKTFYSLDKVIMSANYGAVSKAYCKEDLDKEVMVKVINLENWDEHLFYVIQGLVQLITINHESVWRINSVLCDNEKLYLVMDYDNYVTLSDFILDNGTIEEKDAACVTQQLLEIVKYLNDAHHCYRDLRPENILINPDTLRVKLLNFEFSSFFEEAKALKTKLGSPYYMAPEILSKKYSKEWDVWSVGAIAFCLLTGFPPFLADTPNKIIKQIKSFKLNLVSEEWEGKSVNSMAFIRATLTVDPKYRISVEDALSHPWITQSQEIAFEANPQEIGLDFDEESFDIFLREVFAIMIENFNVDILKSLKDLAESENPSIAKEIIVNDILNIIENTEAYDWEIKNLLRWGLKQLDSRIEYAEFLESVIEEKIHLEQPKFDAEFVFSSSSNTNGSKSEDSTDLDSSSPTKLVHQ